MASENPKDPWILGHLKTYYLARQKWPTRYTEKRLLEELSELACYLIGEAMALKHPLDEPFTEGSRLDRLLRQMLNVLEGVWFPGKCFELRQKLNKEAIVRLQSGFAVGFYAACGRKIDDAVTDTLLLCLPAPDTRPGADTPLAPEERIQGFLERSAAGAKVTVGGEAREATEREKFRENDLLQTYRRFAQELWKLDGALLTLDLIESHYCRMLQDLLNHFYRFLAEIDYDKHRLAMDRYFGQFVHLAYRRAHSSPLASKAPKVPEDELFTNREAHIAIGNLRKFWESLEGYMQENDRLILAMYEFQDATPERQAEMRNAGLVPAAQHIRVLPWDGSYRGAEELKRQTDELIGEDSGISASKIMTSYRDDPMGVFVKPHNEAATPANANSAAEARQRADNCPPAAATANTTIKEPLVGGRCLLPLSDTEKALAAAITSNPGQFGQAISNQLTEQGQGITTNGISKLMMKGTQLHLRGFRNIAGRGYHPPGADGKPLVD